ncbi:STAS domain-containing protein [Rhodococcoides corynebacterioides]|uniref:Anti-sigma factor antagonist n=1 Tax=Rhodococcoides corynebacterioides TaxID=53972 RepID=A0ABS7P898_9NOCA|nr:anti-sigma factor antagonist [Rhodococcus corynebacterioides]MBY6368560.1 anti-sigma factor antagonist [Rhodococcus corynebacterioides]MBY6409471.1 anti-sigma factor antagonist [Rhodococcus corynebacterioides]
MAIGSGDLVTGTAGPMPHLVQTSAIRDTDAGPGPECTTTGETHTMSALDFFTTDIVSTDRAEAGVAQVARVADLTVVDHVRDGVTVLSIGGEIDLGTTPELRDVLVRLAARREDAVVLDLTDVTFLGSAGAVLLLDAASAVAARPIALVAVHPAVRRPLGLLGVCSPITVFETVDEAVESFTDDELFSEVG